MKRATLKRLFLLKGGGGRRSNPMHRYPRGVTLEPPLEKRLVFLRTSYFTTSRRCTRPAVVGGSSGRSSWISVPAGSASRRRRRTRERRILVPIEVVIGTPPAPMTGGPPTLWRQTSLQESRDRFPDSSLQLPELPEYRMDERSSAVAALPVQCLVPRHRQRPMETWLRCCCLDGGEQPTPNLNFGGPRA